MKFTNVQNRYINNKNMGYSVIKGKKASGKTSAAILRTINLENNNCIYNDDNILFLCKDNTSLKKAKDLYDAKNLECNFYSLFSVDRQRVEFAVVSELMDSYSWGYKRSNVLNKEIINYEDGLTILEDHEFVKELELYMKKSKLLRKISINDLYDEFLWIKLCNFTRDQYLNTERRGRKIKINRNTIGREYIFNLSEKYNRLLSLYGIMDENDGNLLAIKQANKLGIKYSHIIVDNTEQYNKCQLDFIKALYRDDNYTSITFIVDTEKSKLNQNFLYSGRRLKELIGQNNSKSFAFRTTFKQQEESIETYLSSYKYVNFKNKNVSQFNIDEASNKKELYLDKDTVFKECELQEIPVFNEIAAGDPIEINDTIERKFFMPKGWLERGKETFILKVKGDSMTDKNICHGDYVVIKKQQTAYNNDIVAASVNGEATLKTLNTNGKVPMLMPANKKYMPITISDKEVSILGVALGVIKQIN